MTRIALYCGAQALAKGLEYVLRNDGRFELMPTCCKTDALMAQVSSSAPDIILLDLTPDVTFTLLAELRRKARHARIVLWVHNISTRMAMQAMEIGIRGILRKKLPPDIQMKCLLRVHAGELWFEKVITEPQPVSRAAFLTPREEQLVRLLSQGLKNSEIASRLGLSEGTVRVYLSQLFQKLGVKDRFELALYGLKKLAPPSAADNCMRDAIEAIIEPHPSGDLSDSLNIPLVPTLQ